MTTRIEHTLEKDLDDAVTEVIAGWDRPGDPREHWRIAARLGWTTILDDFRVDGAVDRDQRELADAACGAVTALARGGFALPLRQTLVARAAAITPVSEVDTVAVHPTAQGLWEPIADVLVSADGSVTHGVPGGEAGRDLADRPYRLAPPPPQEIPRRLTALADVLWCQEMIGAAQGAVAEARRYVTQRVQFGRPLAAIPAVRNLLGQLKIDLRELETSTYEARHRLFGDDSDALTFALVTAREVAAAVSPRIAQTSHQLHGAMGITREAGLHWRTKLLWAGCDEGAARRDHGIEAVPVDEPSLWSLTTPGTLRSGARP
ncbi:acyl-CoA dehydrogenase family protein [Amycolatopsis sp. NPDC059021]|uniref:acyl-CoA dehydrogenase family protein n=1 Tax=Amycolatopsis sp. NPDC059021 TaxID=3346704 RepID=UPI003671C654